MALFRMAIVLCCIAICPVATNHQQDESEPYRFPLRYDVLIGSQPKYQELGDVDGDGELDVVLLTDSLPGVSIVLGNGDGTWAVPDEYTLSSSTGDPKGLSLGDMDDDNDLDILTAFSRGIAAQGSVLLWLNNGDGTFSAPIDIGAARAPESLAIGDLDGDDDLDVVTTNIYQQGSIVYEVSVLLNDGNGNFAPLLDGKGEPIAYPTGAFPISVDTGDFDGDSDRDLVVANVNADDVRIFFNNGDGSFVPGETIYQFSNAPRFVSVNDIDGDSDADVLVCYDGVFLAAMVNDGTGNFDVGLAFESEFGATNVRMADLDSDLDLDCLLSGNRILLNDGQGNFSLAHTLYTGAGVTAIGDVDGDSDLDFVTLPSAGYGFLLVKNRGDTSFEAGIPYQALNDYQGSNNDLRDMDQGDVDGDGDLDLVVIDEGSSNDWVTILKNSGGGEFTVGSSLVYDRVGAVTLADFDSDSDLDIAFTLFHFSGQAPQMAISLNNGDGTFAAANAYDVGEDPQFLEHGDIDGDHDLDLLVVNRTDRNISVMLNNGDGTFVEDSTVSNFGGRDSCRLGDFDGDMDLDLVYPNLSDDYISIFLNDGNGTFVFDRNYGFESLRCVEVFDADGDHDLDIAVSDADTVSIMQNDGSATFAELGVYDTIGWCRQMAPVDIDADSDMDLVVAGVASESTGYAVLVNDGAGVFTTDGLYYLSSPIALAVGDLDGDRDVDLVLLDEGRDVVVVVFNEGDLGNQIEVLGDANGDGVFNNADIASFVLALTNPAAYQAMFPNADPDVVLDMNGDEVFNNADIAAFVAALTGS